MQALVNASRIVAHELRKAERSINIAASDAAQFLLTILDATEAHGLSPAMTQRTVKAAAAAPKHGRNLKATGTTQALHQIPGGLPFQGKSVRDRYAR